MGVEQAAIYKIVSCISVFTSIIAVCIFFFAAHRVDSRFVQGLVATYEQEIGSAFYFYSSGALLHFIVFILSIVIAYQSLRESREATAAVNDATNMPVMRELAPLYRQHQWGKTQV